MDIFGKQQIEQLNARIEYLSANAKRLEQQITDCAQQRDEALKLAEKARTERDQARKEAEEARQALSEFEASLKRSMRQLGGLLYVGENHWLDPQSVAEIKIQLGTLEINGQKLESGSPEEMLALAHSILDARQQAQG